MPRKGTIEERIIFALRQAEESKKVGDICREIGFPSKPSRGISSVERAVEARGRRGQCEAGSTAVSESGIAGAEDEARQTSRA